MVRDFLLTLLVFSGIDFLWLVVVAKSFYDKHFLPFERTTNWLAIVLVYLIISLGIVVFVLPKARGDLRLALFWGALYGLIVYGVYDLTNLAVLKDWSSLMVVVDILWGMFICGLTSSIMAYFT